VLIIPAKALKVVVALAVTGGVAGFVALEKVVAPISPSAAVKSLHIWFNLAVINWWAKIIYPLPFGAVFKIALIISAV
jgi:hypothetical protein